MMSSDLIMAGEKYAVDVALKNSQMPTPRGDVWRTIKEHYKLPDPQRIDNVLSMVTLPAGWRNVKNPDDPYGRSTDIFDEQNRKVGGTFLKDTPYDRVGYTTFDSVMVNESLGMQ